VQIAAEPIQTNLPAAASDLVGRTTRYGILRDLLSAYRLVTLTGTGGIGKTRLVLEVARGLFPSFQGDVRLVELPRCRILVSCPPPWPGARPELGGDQISAESVARAMGARDFCWFSIIAST